MTTKLNDYFERFTGKLLEELGCQIIEEQPSVGKKRSDFLVATPSGAEFYVEATAVKHKSISESPPEIDVCKKLNEMCNFTGFYWFMADATGKLSQELSKKKLRPIKKWIEGLSTKEPRSCRKRFVYSRGILLQNSVNPADEWILNIRADPRTENRREVLHPILVGIGRSGNVDSASPLVRAAKAKGKQHKSIKKPLVLAMSDMGDIPSGPIDVALALFGWEQDVGEGVFGIMPPSEKLRRASIWGRRENTTISAILLFHELSPDREPHARVCLYENPWARYPIPVWLKETLPHARVEEKSNTQLLYMPSEQCLSSVRGLSAESSP